MARLPPTLRHPQGAPTQMLLEGFTSSASPTTIPAGNLERAPGTVAEVMVNGPDDVYVEREGRVEMVSGIVAIVAGMTAEPWWSPSEVCRVCTERSEGSSTSFLCSRCRRIYEQGGPGLRKKQARFQAMRAQWNEEAKAFLCYFTDFPLTDRVPGSRTSATWEHLTPGDPWSVVLASDLVNKIKGNMTETQFRRMVVALADHFRTNEPFNRKAFPVEASPFDATDESEPDTPPATP